MSDPETWSLPDERLPKVATCCVPTSEATQPKAESRFVSEATVMTTRELVTELEDSLFRAVTLSESLSGFGKHWTQASTESMYEVQSKEYSLSFQTQRYHHFLSHDWKTSRWAKFWSLLILFNHGIATLAMLICCAIVGLCRESGALLGEDEGRVHRLTTSLLPWLVHTFFFFFWQRIRSLAQRPLLVFLDKLCIAQHDAELKQRGILGLAAFLGRSDHLTILWSRRYLTRLWCGYELATFLRDSSESKSLTFFPVSMALVVILPTIYMCMIKVQMQLDVATLAVSMGLADLEVGAGWKGLVVFRVLPGVCIVFATMPFLFYSTVVLFRDISTVDGQLKDFSLEGSECFCCANDHRHPDTGEALPCDRNLVYEAVRLWYGADTDTKEEHLKRFDRMVHTRLRPRVLAGADSAIFPARMMIHMALVSSAPRLCDAFTMVRDLHLEYPQADWSALQHFWKALCAFSFCLVDFSIDALVLRIVYTTAFGHISQRLSRMMSDMKAALLLTVINLPLPVAARTLLMFVFLERIPYDLRPVYALALLLLVLCFFRTSFCRRQ
ncbi:unnamed protein product [Effrenium voratum]|nr:unnamed protein product [Effrenium voratum]